MHIDQTILDWIQSTLRSPFMDNVMSFITRLGDYGTIWILLGIILLLFPKTRRCGFTVLLSLAISSFAANILIKPLISRIRPFYSNPEIALFIPPPSGYSFPSGHSTSSFAAATSVFLCNKAAGIPTLILAFLVAFSRLYLYVHYPSDVLTGAILGIVSAILIEKLVDKWIPKFSAYFSKKF